MSAHTETMLFVHRLPLKLIDGLLLNFNRHLSTINRQVGQKPIVHSTTRDVWP
jgi:hypothetical protein